MRFPIACCAPLLALPLAVLALPLRTDTAGDRPAPAGIYFTDPARTSLSWSVAHPHLARWTARFEAPEATLDWRPEAPERSRLFVRIDPVSVRTDMPWPGLPELDERIARDREFLAGKIITFTSTRIEVTGAGTARVHGLLELRGEAHPATLDVTFEGSALTPGSGEARVGFSAVGRIRRSDWGMDALAILGDEVEIAIEAQFAPGSA